jgi:hypothetical protein
MKEQFDGRYNERKNTNTSVRDGGEEKKSSGIRGILWRECTGRGEEMGETDQFDALAPIGEREKNSSLSLFILISGKRCVFQFPRSAPSCAAHSFSFREPPFRFHSGGCLHGCCCVHFQRPKNDTLFSCCWHQVPLEMRPLFFSGRATQKN